MASVGSSGTGGGGPPSEEDLRKLRVVDLKERLSQRGLSTGGLKADLVKRLYDALVQENVWQCDNTASMVEGAPTWAEPPPLNVPQLGWDTGATGVWEQPGAGAAPWPPQPQAAAMWHPVSYPALEPVQDWEADAGLHAEPPYLEPEEQSGGAEEQQQAMWQQQQQEKEDEEKRNRIEQEKQLMLLRQKEEELCRQQEAAMQNEMLRQQQEAAHQEELRRQQEEAIRQEEMRRQQEAALQEELRRQQEEAALQEELRRQQEEAARLDEIRRQQAEVARQEELRRQQEAAAHQEELRRQQEAALQEELRRQQEEAARQEELRRQQEEAARQEELRKQEEEAAQQEAIRRQKEEAARQEEIRRQQEEARRQEEIRKQKEEEEARQRQALIQLQQEQEALRQQQEHEEKKRQEEEIQAKQREEQRLKELEEQRRLEEEERQRKEAEEEEQRQREERQRQEEERLREEELLRRQQEAERERLEKEEEERRQQEEEERIQRQLEEDECRRQEEERIRIQEEEEACRREEELRHQREEEERQRQEVLRIQKEEEEKKRRELLKQEEEKKRLEAVRRRKEEEERRQKQEEERRAEEQEKARQKEQELQYAALVQDKEEQARLLRMQRMTPHLASSGQNGQKSMRDETGVAGDHSGENEENQEPMDGQKESKNKRRKMKKKMQKVRRRIEKEIQQDRAEREAEEAEKDEEIDVKIEYIPDTPTVDLRDPFYHHFMKVFEAFKLHDPEMEEKAKREEAERLARLERERELSLRKKPKDVEEDMDDEKDEGKEEVPKLSKRKMKKLTRLSIAELKQHVSRPDVVEMHDVTARDPKMLVWLKAYRNTVPVPRHWCFKRKYLQGKRGIEKPPFNLPDFIKRTGIMEMRQALQDKEDQKTVKAKMRERVRPKLGKIDIDYQKLHDAFFKWQTKPRMSIHGDLYYEGKEFETRLKEKKPGELSDELRNALGMPVGPNSNRVPPPWLIAMQRYGPPPSYPNLKVPGLNAPIPEGCSFGYHAGGWGKPPVDELGRPLYGDVFGVQLQDPSMAGDDDELDRSLWGELESESESESDEEESEEEEPDEEEVDNTGIMTPGMEGLVTPSGLTSIPTGMETPDMIELRKRKIESEMESGDQPALYTILPEKKTERVGGAMMGSTHIYDMSAAIPTKAKPGYDKPFESGVEVALDPSELDMDTSAMAARYEATIREQQGLLQKEDLSDMVAEHAAKQKNKRKKQQDIGKSAKKYNFKF